MCIKTKTYATQIFDNSLRAIRKRKVLLKLNRLAYIEMCILELSKVLMHKFHYEYIEIKYGKK